MWKLSYNFTDSSNLYGLDEGIKNVRGPSEVVLVWASALIDSVLSFADEDQLQHDILERIQAFHEGGRPSRVTLAHLLSNKIIDGASQSSCFFCSGEESERELIKYSILPLHLLKGSQSASERNSGVRGRTKRFRSSKRRKLSNHFSPFVLERSDIWCDKTRIHVNVAIKKESFKKDSVKGVEVSSSTTFAMDDFVRNFLSKQTQKIVSEAHSNLLSHVANTVLQTKLRLKLPSLGGIAFIANGTIMPRKSGASFSPMASPPAIPFEAPKNSSMTQQITIDMGKLGNYLTKSNIIKSDGFTIDEHMITLEGLLIPKGITLIVGGGYHGKSTLLRTIASGVYNKVLGDGRELCVTDGGAISVRAEDGRYVNNTNISAFISNLPPTIGGGSGGPNPQKFCTREASGSTSQATNVSEAIELGASAMLVDEDVSAANFMSRDGRMRALVMDESITPLLYRVNGIYNSKGISSIVVVGGVGDWLDVPHAVIQMNKYVAYDALKKARSISAQFSYGHVEYGGRGVVHRLPWEEEGTPRRRRPTIGDSVLPSIVSLLDGGGRFSLDKLETFTNSIEMGNVFENGDNIGDDHHEEDDNGEEDFHIVDMARCEQLLGGNWQLYGVAICSIWVLMMSRKNSSWDFNELLNALEDELDREYGLLGLIQSLSRRDSNHNSIEIIGKSELFESLLFDGTGFAYRPRKYEVAMALTRLRGLVFEDLPDELDKKLEAERLEAEQRKKALADLWANRRKK